MEDYIVLGSEVGRWVVVGRSVCFEKGCGGRVIMLCDVGWEELGKEGRGGEKVGGRWVFVLWLLGR